MPTNPEPHRRPSDDVVPGSRSESSPASGAARGPLRRTAISLIAPVFDEEGNLERLYEEVRRTFADGDFELILVDDGSRDSSR